METSLLMDRPEHLTTDETLDLAADMADTHRDELVRMLLENDPRGLENPTVFDAATYVRALEAVVDAARARCVYEREHPGFPPSLDLERALDALDLGTPR